MTIMAAAFLSAKIIGLGFVGLGFSSLTSAFHQYSFKLDKKGVKNNDIEAMREKAKQLG